MPNWMLSSNQQDLFTQAVRALTDKQVFYAETGLPLSRDQIQAAIAPAEVRGMLKRLEEFGIDSLQKAVSVTAAITREQGVKRDACVRLYVDNAAQLYYCWDTQTSAWHGQQAFQNRRFENIPFDMEVLDAETRAKFINWIDKAVQERRRAQLTRETVGGFLGLNKEKQYQTGGNYEWVVSMAKILARWPAMRVVFKNMAEGRGAFGKAGADWSKRVDEAPRNVKTGSRWVWPRWGEEADWRRNNDLNMQVAEQMLINAASLPPVPKEGKPSGDIQAWHKLEGERL